MDDHLGDLLKLFSSTSRWTILALLLKDSILFLAPKGQKTSQCPLRCLLIILQDHGLARWPSPAGATTLYRFSGTIICRVLALSHDRESDTGTIMFCTNATWWFLFFCLTLILFKLCWIRMLKYFCMFLSFHQAQVKKKNLLQKQFCVVMVCVYWNYIIASVCARVCGKLIVVKIIYQNYTPQG